MALGNVYYELAAQVMAGDSKIVPELLAMIANEEEARLVLVASPPATAQELAERSGIGPAKVEQMLPVLFKKGLVFTSRKGGATRYYRVRHLLQLHDATILWEDAPKEFLELWKKHTREELPGYLKAVEGALASPVVRVVAVGASLDTKSKVLAYDEVKGLIDEASRIAVTKCTCRLVDGGCGKLLEACIQLGRAADYAVERGTGRELSREEALELLEKCEEEGLVHVSENKSSGGHVICNCCSDCCVNWPSVRMGLRGFVAPSRFQARVSEELCDGCELCLERCYFGALTMAGDGGSRATVDGERCMGCGLCAVVCPTDAITLGEVRPREFIPVG